jgi:hypothetical protein
MPVRVLISGRYAHLLINADPRRVPIRLSKHRSIERATVPVTGAQAAQMRAFLVPPSASKTHE